MTLNEALEHASKAVAVGCDYSYDVDQDALAVLYQAYKSLCNQQKNT